eukprot:TRINITY_DN60539_c0_g1_i1.p1 TRINITY_DN60539_c0_g1~~TRINITY_DN60539_c0_g1_i1.p1  ORF type:complete len:666 (+),score=188.40 TRINITY_DN60539_c0_g1_i1:136-2133(+)
MGNLVGNLVQNLWQENADEEKSRFELPSLPGPIRKGLRRVRAALVRGQGRRLLPEWYEDEERGYVCRAAQFPDECFECARKGGAEVVPVLLCRGQMWSFNESKGDSIRVGIDPAFCTINNFKALVSMKLTQLQKKNQDGTGFQYVEPIPPDKMRLEVRQGRWVHREDGDGADWVTGVWDQIDTHWEFREEDESFRTAVGTGALKATCDDYRGFRLIADMTNGVAHQSGAQPPEFEDPAARLGAGIPIHVVDTTRLSDVDEDSLGEEDEQPEKKRNITIRFKKKQKREDEPQGRRDRRASQWGAAGRRASVASRRRSSVAQGGILKRSRSAVSMGRESGVSSATGVHRERSKSVYTVTGEDELDDEIVIQRRIQQEGKYKRELKEKQLSKAVGCRRQIDEVAMTIFVAFFTIVMFWSWAVWLSVKNNHGDEQYDRANEVFYSIDCPQKTDLNAWWFYNALLNSIMLLLFVVSETFYWYVTPLSSEAALTTYDPGRVRGFICLLWFVSAFLNMLQGSQTIWDADPDLCGSAAVGHGKAILALQYIWFPLHCILFQVGNGGDLNRKALRSCWCVESRSALATGGEVGEVRNMDLDHYAWRLVRSAGEERELADPYCEGLKERPPGQEDKEAVAGRIREERPSPPSPYELEDGARFSPGAGHRKPYGGD